MPKHVHWEEFLGPAPMRPYAVAFAPRPAYHPHDWRGYWDFGTGALGDMACHTANMAFRALQARRAGRRDRRGRGDQPGDVPGVGAHPVPASPPAATMPACVLHWYEGKRDGKTVLPPEELLAKLLKKGEKLSDSGSILVGDKGMLFSPNDYGAKFRLTPDKDFTGIQTAKPEKGTEGVDNEGRDADQQMKKEWADAIKAGKPALASSNFDYAGRLTEAMLLGNIAVRFAGKKLEWDAAKLTFTNSADATKLVSKEYRKGWDFLAKS